MCGRLDYYLHLFARLRVDKNRKTWSRLTTHCSPYKPALLLSVLDHIGSGRITRNFIDPSFELVETFLGYISLIPDLRRQAPMSYPFYHLESADFWELIPQPGETHRKGRTIKSMKALRKRYMGARFSNDLYMIAQMAHTRERLRNILIETYFARELQPAFIAQSIINYTSDKYAFSLLTNAEATPPYEYPVPVEKKENIRCQGFRKAIVTLYDHRCALCGIKMCTPEGRTVVDAAHIVPWSESKNDQPTNGMALCKLCHWSFDEGLMSVDDQYHVLISPTVRNDNNLPGHIMTLSDRPIFRPQGSTFWPDRKGFDWHRKERFRR